MIRTLTLLIAALLAGSPEARATDERFVDAAFYYSAAGAHLLSTRDYHKAVDSLTAQFDEVCGDSYCEGEYSNWRSLEFTCGVDVVTSDVTQCLWTFAGSYSDIDQRTGRPVIVSTVRQCDLGFQGDATALAAFLAEAGDGRDRAHGFLTAVIPGHAAEDGTLFESLSDCLR